MSQEKMNNIIESEKRIYKNLIFIRYSLLKQYQIILNYYYNDDKSVLKNDTEYNKYYDDWLKNSDKYNTELAAYQQRQKEYRSQPKSYFQELKDSVYKSLQAAYNRFEKIFSGDDVQGVGYAALLIPLAKWIGPILLTWVASIFYDKVMNSDNDTKTLASKLADTNPEAAIELSKIASEEEVKIKKAESENSLMGQLGKGLKITAVVGTIFLGYKYVVSPEIDKRKKQ